MRSTHHDPSPGLAPLFEELAAAARATGLFPAVDRTTPGRVHCTAAAQPAAAFRIDHDQGKFWVCWVSPDRYLSQSIEADLMWTGDDLNELIEEELAESGYIGNPLGRTEHFRDEDKLFTFRSLIPVDADAVDAGVLLKCLLAYNAAFAELGDMKGKDEEE